MSLLHVWRYLGLTLSSQRYDLGGDCVTGRVIENWGRTWSDWRSRWAFIGAMMAQTDLAKITILVGSMEWIEQAARAFGPNHLFFDARSVGASLTGLRAVVDEFGRTPTRHIVVTMPHGEDDVRRVGFLLKKSVQQTVEWMDETMAAAQPVAPWIPCSKSIETQRLLLTLPTPKQIDDYYDEIVGTRIFDTILWEGPSDTSELHDFWLYARQRQLLDEYPPVQFAILEKSSGRYIGGCGLRTIGAGHDRLDLGYALAARYHGHGFATEAVGALVDYGFTHLGAQRISGEVFVGNDASARVLSKIGFINEGTHYGSVKKRGRWIDAWMFGLTKEIWSKRDGTVTA